MSDDDQIKDDELEPKDPDAPLNIDDDDLGEVVVADPTEEIVDGVYVDEEEEEDDDLDIEDYDDKTDY